MKNNVIVRMKYKTSITATITTKFEQEKNNNESIHISRAFRVFSLCVDLNNNVQYIC